jgi:hypothetical protein
MRLRELIDALYALEQLEGPDTEVLIQDRESDLYDVANPRIEDDGDEYPTEWNIPTRYIQLRVF